MNIDEATNIKQIFDKVGIENVSNITKTYGTGVDESQLFNAIAKGDEELKFIFSIDERKLFSATYTTHALFTSLDGFSSDIEVLEVPECEISLNKFENLK